jgi:hypothetical protein
MIKRTYLVLPVFAGLFFIAAPQPQFAGIDWPVVGAWALRFLRDYLTFAIIGGLALWLTPRLLNEWSENVHKEPFKSFSLGILSLFAGYGSLLVFFFIVLAIAIGLFMIKLNVLGWIFLGIGLPSVGIAFGVLNLLVAYISKIVVALLIGILLLGSLKLKKEPHRIWSLLLGLLIYLLVRAIPWLGWAVGVIVTLIGLGAIWISLVRWISPRPATTATPPLAEVVEVIEAEPEQTFPDLEESTTADGTDNQQ